MLFAQNNTLGKTILQKYSNCFLGVKKGCKSRNCLIYTLYCEERGIRKAKPSRGHISKNNPYLATQPPLRENPLEKAAAGIAAFCCGTERPSCCSDDLLETKKSDRQKFVAAAAFDSRRERLSNLCYLKISHNRKYLLITSLLQS